MVRVTHVSMHKCLAPAPTCAVQYGARLARVAAYARITLWLREYGIRLGPGLGDVRGASASRVGG
jgi:hypothetical protein